MKTFSAKLGWVTGTEHTLRQANCQDKLRFERIAAHGKEYLCGVVCDGCSEGLHSEVGAGLLAEFVVREVARLLAAGCALPELPSALHARALSFLTGLTGWLLGESLAPPELAALTRDYLLTTVLGFVVGAEQTVVFATGDGLVIINDQVYRREEDNRPAYLAYGLLDPSWLTDHTRRKEFDLMVVPTSRIEKMAIWTDGFDPALHPQIWGLGGPRRLQRKLNLWSRQKKFSDDTAGIIIEREQLQHESNN